MTTLNNCYLPLPPVKSAESKRRLLSSSKSVSQSNDDESDSTRGRLSMRQTHLTVNCLSNAAGSSLVEIGHTKVVCAVYGPHAAPVDYGEFHVEGKLNCVVSMPLQNTCVSSAAERANIVGDEAELSSNVRDAIMSSLMNLEKISKSVIDVNVKVLQDDGGALVASIIAASLALADANIECCDLIAACQVCAVQDSNNSSSKSICLLDPTEMEVNGCHGTVTVALMPNMKEVTYWEQVGRLNSEISSESISLCRDGCTSMYKLMRTCLINSRDA